MDDQDPVLIKHQRHDLNITAISCPTNPQQPPRLLVVEPALAPWTGAPGSQYFRLKHFVLQSRWVDCDPLTRIVTRNQTVARVVTGTHPHAPPFGDAQSADTV
jgi:hypothetical protein